MSTKILYMEDESFLGKIVKESLESRGYEIFMEEDGAKAISLFKACSPDICVLDVMLPNKDGFAIADEIRKVDTNNPNYFSYRKIANGRSGKGFSIRWQRLY